MKKVLGNTRTLVMLGLMLAMTMILDLTPLGAIPMGTVVATIAHLPTILVGIILGPVAGLIAGLSFGIVSLLHALIRPASPFSLLFINPLVSVLPRMMIGVTAYYAYHGVVLVLKGQKANPIAIGIGAAIGSLTNTVLVMTALVLLYGERVKTLLFDLLGLESTAFAWAIGVASTNGLVEAIVSVIIIVPIGVIYIRQQKS